MGGYNYGRVHLWEGIFREDIGAHPPLLGAHPPDARGAPPPKSGLAPRAEDQPGH